MSLESIQSFLALALGFAVAGVLATGYQFITERPASFQLIWRGPSLGALAAVPFLVFAAPFIILRNTIKVRRVENRGFEFVMFATIFAGFWSLMSGTIIVMALRALAGLPV
jgi:uncharacterized protein DUF6949